MSATRVKFEHELSSLQEQILEMATCADTMVAQSVDALITCDLALAQQVIRQDDIVDRLDLLIEARCLHLIATQQPVARDLRLIGTALKVITDIERIGDYAVDIAKIGRRLGRAQLLYRPLVDLPLLSGLSRRMLHEALQAFVAHDLDQVARVIASDDAVDRLYHTMRGDLMQTLASSPEQSLLAMNVLFAAKYLERVSDHVVNIAERVAFIETGELKYGLQTVLLEAEKAV